MRDKILYFILGITASILIFIFISATNSDSSEVGRYQLSATDRAPIILDTKTGEIKVFFTDGIRQFDYTTNSYKMLSITTNK